MRSSRRREETSSQAKSLAIFRIRKVNWAYCPYGKLRESQLNQVSVEISSALSRNANAFLRSRRCA